jgi:hypothetical protein
MGWLVALATVLIVAVQASALAAVWLGLRPRLPPLSAVAPLLDRAIASTVTAVGDRAAITISSIVPYTACRDTFLATGSRFNRVADLYTDPGQEDTLIGYVTTHLPGSDHARRTPPVGGGAPPMTADIGAGVHLHLTQLGDGWLEAVAETDCRAGHGPPPGTDATATPATIDHLLAAVGTTLDAWHTDSIACPGGRLTTLSAISHTVNTDNLPQRLAALVPANAHPFASQANRLAWRDPTGSTVVAASDDGMHITVQHTNTC